MGRNPRSVGRAVIGSLSTSMMDKRLRAALDSANEKNPSHPWTHTGDVPFGPDAVHSFRLANGLRLLLLVDRQAPTVSYFTWFRVGSRHEKPGKTGLAHLFEHLMFNETEGLAAGKFDRKLEEAGAETNAATWLDWTYYYESLPKDRLGLAITLESQRMSKLVLREPQVTSELEVVANERRFRVEDDVEGAANELLYKTAFDKHPYHWPTIGWMEDIKAFTPQDCEAFYATYYAPNNATLVVVGDVSERDVLTKIAKAYGPLPAGDVPEEDTMPDPPQTAPREAEISRPTATEKVLLGYKGPALGDAEHAVLSVLNEVLFGGRASRLYDRLVVKDELATDLRGWVSTFRDPGLYEVFLTARAPHGRAEVLAAFDDEIARVKNELISVDELERATARLELGLLQSLDTAAGKAEQIGFYDTVLGDPRGAFSRLDAYRRVTRGEVRTAARRWLDANARTAIHVIPNGAPPPDDEGDEPEDPDAATTDEEVPS
jgi:zinc protease